ncbi:group 1 glycosyl transferase [Acidovorax sp. KKS102]|uniref:glycosyltransferase family 4 protein n=1 Tax=Acidovorax sp. KKS102 TaxID=358220 RepID=UPI00028B7A42|nr:glycosyltransferase family 1 protein [Acidovorax sp. KKS102]AFU44356.1 group 1 glycosyl transferase [Acidovorax sp. KKS102]
MKISIDATGLGQAKTGTTVYLTQILAQWNQRKDLAHTFIIFVAPKARHHFTALGLDGRFRLRHAPNARFLRVLWQQTLLPVHLLQLGVCVHWGPGFVLPVLGLCPMVVTVHDLTFQLFPAAHERIKRHYFPWMIRRAVRKAHSVLVISHTTKADLERLQPESRHKNHVTLLGARTLPSIEPLQSSVQDYALFIGTLEPRKNLRNLIQAWRSLATTIRGQTHLRVVGTTGWLVQDVIDSANEQDNIHFLGSLTDQALAAQLQGASFFVYPSLYEGFGLPVLEAMSIGIPVLTSNVGATQEIAGAAALLVDPHSVTSIAQGLARLLQEPELLTSLRAAGLERAAQFSWAQTASQTLQALQAAGTHSP